MHLIYSKQKYTEFYIKKINESQVHQQTKVLSTILLSLKCYMEYEHTQSTSLDEVFPQHSVSLIFLKVMKLKSGRSDLQTLRDKIVTFETTSSCKGNIFSSKSALCMCKEPHACQIPKYKYKATCASKYLLPSGGIRQRKMISRVTYQLDCEEQQRKIPKEDLWPSHAFTTHITSSLKPHPHKIFKEKQVEVH